MKENSENNTKKFKEQQAQNYMLRNQMGQNYAANYYGQNMPGAQFPYMMMMPNRQMQMMQYYQMQNMQMQNYYNDNQNIQMQNAYQNNNYQRKTELANQQVTYSIDTDNTTLGVGEYTLTGNKLTIAENIVASGEVHVVATTVGKDSGGQSKSATCVVTVTKAVIAQIIAVNVSGAVTPTEQYVGKDFDYTGLTFTPVWSEGEHETVTITGADIVWPALTNGMTSIKGQYDTGSSKLDVDVSGFTVVEDYLKSITIAGDMTNKTYYSNADFQRVHKSNHIVTP